RRIRRARRLAKQLGLRLSNLRGLDGGGDGGWVLAEPRSFDEVEAELMERMRERQNFQDHTYAKAYPPVLADMVPVENGDGESVPVQYISVDICRQCGTMVHDQLAHNSWHSWMLSLCRWMGTYRHDRPVNEGQSALQEREQRLGRQSKRRPRK